jgi:hypothetical protein
MSNTSVVLKTAAWMAVMAFVSVDVTSAAIVTSFSASGNVSAEVQAVPAMGGIGAAGTVTLSSIPEGATIQQAYLYSHKYFSKDSSLGNASADFAGTFLGTVGPLATNQEFGVYRWDVTSLVAGNGDYFFSTTTGPENYGAALAVAFSHPSLPVGQVFFNDGAFDLNNDIKKGNESNSTTFNVAAAGTGTITNFTGADNSLGETDEVISFNGVAVGGPLDANIGSYASLDVDVVSAVAGINTASIMSPTDRFGWSLSVLEIQQDVVIPEPGTLAIWSLLGLTGAGVAGWRRRRNR